MNKKDLKIGDKIIGKVVMCPRIDIHAKHNLIDKIITVETDVVYTIEAIPGEHVNHVIAKLIFDGKESQVALSLDRITFEAGQFKHT